MANTHTWKINSLEREVADGYVRSVSFTVNTKDDSGNEVDQNEDIFLAKPSTLVAYNTLTENTVIGWVKAAVAADSHYSKDLETKGNELLTQKQSVAQGVPW